MQSTVSTLIVVFLGKKRYSAKAPNNIIDTIIPTSQAFCFTQSVYRLINIKNNILKYNKSVSLLFVYYSLYFFVPTFTIKFLSSIHVYTTLTTLLRFFKSIDFLIYRGTYLFTRNILIEFGYLLPLTAAHTSPRRAR